jgi:hypothetical protein
MIKAAGLIGGWLTLTIAGMGVLLNYKQTAGGAAVAPASWPKESTIVPAKDRFTLVMIVHPRCPCSRASVGELGKLMTRLGSRLEAHMLAIVPDGAGEEWESSDLAKSAAEIQNVSVRVDRSGREAKLFGALTSGQTYLYSPTGELQFSGGITASRGHYGDNLGSAEIERLTLAGNSDQAEEPRSSKVYGCELHDPQN